MFDKYVPRVYASCLIQPLFGKPVLINRTSVWSVDVNRCAFVGARLQKSIWGRVKIWKYPRRKYSYGKDVGGADHSEVTGNKRESFGRVIWRLVWKACLWWRCLRENNRDVVFHKWDFFVPNAPISGCFGFSTQSCLRMWLLYLPVLFNLKHIISQLFLLHWNQKLLASLFQQLRDLNKSWSKLISQGFS